MEIESVPNDPYSSTTKEFSAQGIIVMFLTIGISLLFTYWVTGRMLRPLTNLTNSIREIDENSLNQRAQVPKSEDEVFLLTKSFNGMMDRLEESFVIQKNFASNAAHELKTPLSVIYTALQVMEMDEETSIEEYQEFTQDTKVCIERLRKTVDSLLALANEPVESANDIVEVKSLLKQVIKELSPKAEEKKVIVSLTGKENQLICNKTLLYRALYNLIENAIKYNREGGKVEIRLFIEDDKSRIEIIDTGIGMSEEDMHHIFEPFYRADRSRSQKVPGSGLGMAIVKLIIERYHGQILVKSKIGQGTSVTIFL
ncbi:ATP-binding protein [Bacillus sp. 1P06AnD]|uniref:HAMP domain-containing sensor histidine kinase n=1 Tax=Bacillus sp. 1P06AnD TaxID=3132208 RepID=UPI0039A3135C